MRLLGSRRKLCVNVYAGKLLVDMRCARACTREAQACAVMCAT